MNTYKFGFWLLIALALLWAAAVVGSATTREAIPEPTYTRCEIEKGRMYCISGTEAFWKAQSL